MLNKRQFISSGIAMGGLGLAGANAQTAKPEYTLPEEFLPREVRIRDTLPAGEIHVDPNRFVLYLTLPKRRAIRYTVGVGRGNLYHDGTFYVGAKREWPSWKPTPAMMKREPAAYKSFLPGGRYEKGMAGGPDNPLGARAIYLFDERGDSYLRIHGTNAPRTIGTAVSNGCARLINPHVIDLYDRVSKGARVVLYKKANAGPSHS
jgi:lipoprotein-anchoring transpeptidase ErfK/SrfK